MSNNYNPKKSQPLLFLRFLIFIIAIAIQFDVVMIGPISAVSLLIILYLFISLPYVLTNQKIIYRYRKFNYLLLGFLLLLIINNIININIISAQILPKGILLGVVFFLFALVQLTIDPPSFNYILYGILIGGILMAFCFLFNWGVDFDEGNGRLKIFGQNSNNLGCLMCMSIAIIFHNIIFLGNKYKVYKLVSIIVIIPMVLLIFATASRTALLSLFIIIVTFFFLSISSLSPWKRLLFIILIPLGLYFAYQYFLNSDLLYSRVISSIENVDSGGRDVIWGRLLPIALNHPLGMGITGYTEYAYKTFHTTYIEGTASPHNVFLEVFLYTGIFGFILYFSFWLRLVKISLNSYKRTKILLPLMLMEIFTIQMMLGQLLNFRTAWLSYTLIIFVGYYSVGYIKSSNK